MANILIVDDEPDVLEALARALRLAGHTVSTALDAEKALTLSTEYSFDLVVLDYLMPSMSGIELLNKIRTFRPTIRSIIVSGKIDNDVSEESITSELRDRIEADIYLHKPLANPTLLDAINELLTKSEAADWVSIAERNLKARKTQADVRAAEEVLDKLRTDKKR